MCCGVCSNYGVVRRVENRFKGVLHNQLINLNVYQSVIDSSQNVIIVILQAVRLNAIRNGT